MGFAVGPWAMEGRRGPRVRRGDVRAAALALLAEEPRNGYQLIQEIAERSGGVWQPSPGSVYPALQQLEDEGLIQAETPEGGRKRYALTPGVYTWYVWPGFGPRSAAEYGQLVGSSTFTVVR